MKLAIYSFATEEGGIEKRKISYQEMIGRQYADWIDCAEADCEFYRDVVAHVGDPRPEYQRLVSDIFRRRIGEVWALGARRLFPVENGDQQTFESLCHSNGVQVSFTRTGVRLPPSEPGPARSA